MSEYQEWQTVPDWVAQGEEEEAPDLPALPAGPDKIDQCFRWIRYLTRNTARGLLKVEVSKLLFAEVRQLIALLKDRERPASNAPAGMDHTAANRPTLEELRAAVSEESKREFLARAGAVEAELEADPAWEGWDTSRAAETLVSPPPDEDETDEHTEEGLVDGTN